MHRLLTNLKITALAVIFRFVGAGRIELPTFRMWTERSATELSAHIFIII